MHFIQVWLTGNGIRFQGHVLPFLFEVTNPFSKASSVLTSDILTRQLCQLYEKQTEGEERQIKTWSQPCGLSLRDPSKPMDNREASEKTGQLGRQECSH